MEFVMLAAGVPNMMDLVFVVKMVKCAMPAHASPPVPPVIEPLFQIEPLFLFPLAVALLFLFPLVIALLLLVIVLLFFFPLVILPRLLLIYTLRIMLPLVF